MTPEERQRVNEIGMAAASGGKYVSSQSEDILWLCGLADRLSAKCQMLAALEVEWLEVIKTLRNKIEGTK